MNSTTSTDINKPVLAWKEVEPEAVGAHLAGLCEVSDSILRWLVGISTKSNKMTIPQHKTNLA